jgi:hypothetical protein
MLALRVCGLVALVAIAFWLSSFSEPVPIPPGGPFKLPLYFIENRGQTHPDIGYYVSGRHAAAYFTRNAVYYSFEKQHRFEQASLGLPRQRQVRLDFLGANLHPTMEAPARTSAIVSHFHGPPENWKTGIPTYSSVFYRDLWPDIDLEFSGPEGLLKYTLHVRPGADPRQIRFAYRGASRVTLTPDGRLTIDTPGGGFMEDRPVAWQDSPASRTPVSAAFRLRGDELTFDIGSYDPALPLTIDPVVLLYAGFFGGSGSDEGWAIAVDAAGNTYLTGSAQTGLPVSVGPELTFDGGLLDAFVAKINPAGTALLYAGYLGGSGYDRAYGIAVDAAGNAYIAGYTDSTQATFPVLVGPDLTHNGGMDVFVAKVNPSGSGLVYCGYIGGSGTDYGYGIAVDNTGNTYITGETTSTHTTFPVLSGPDLTHNGGVDAFVSKVNPSGTALLYSGFLGGSGTDSARAIAVDTAGNAYITGSTNSTEATFPVTIGPDLTHNGAFDAFVVKVNSTGSALLYSGYIGGSASEAGWGIAVDPVGNAYVTGYTSSTQAAFPVVSGPILTYLGGSTDAFVTKVNPGGVTLLYSGFVGGSAADVARSIAVDAAGNAYIAGYTSSTNFPVLHGPQLTYSGSQDAMFAKINATGTALVYSGFIGGSALDDGTDVAVDAAGNAYLSGFTGSTQATFPVTTGPDLTFNGGADAFVAKLSAFPSTAGPVMALRNGFNAIETGTFPSPALRNAGGNFRLNPVLALSPSGRAFLIGRDSAVGVWINTLNPDETYTGWLFAGGNSPGQPALAVAGETAWIAVRDPWNSYSVRTYNPSSGFGSWTWLQGVLASDPQIAACPNGDLYVTGRDNSNGVWTRRYSSSLSAWQPWRFIGGIITGTPAIACGADNAAYIAARDPSNNMWLARAFQESAPSWHYGAGIFHGDLTIATNGNLLHVFGLSSGVPHYRTWLVGTGWQGWTSPGGVLTHLAPAVYGAHVFLTGQDANGNLWWWSSLGNSWRNFGSKNVAPGSAFSAGAR